MLEDDIDFEDFDLNKNYWINQWGLKRIRSNEANRSKIEKRKIRIEIMDVLESI